MADFCTPNKRRFQSPPAPLLASSTSMVMGSAASPKLRSARCLNPPKLITMDGFVYGTLLETRGSQSQNCRASGSPKQIPPVAGRLRGPRQIWGATYISSSGLSYRGLSAWFASWRAPFLGPMLRRSRRWHGTCSQWAAHARNALRAVAAIVRQARCKRYCSWRRSASSRKLQEPACDELAVSGQNEGNKGRYKNYRH